MKRGYEYEIVKITPESTGKTSHDFDEEKMNEIISEYGNDGWELVNVMPAHDQGTTSAILFVFKKTHQW